MPRAIAGISALVLVLAAQACADEGTSPEWDRQMQHVAARRQAQRSRRALSRSVRASREAEERQRLREHAEALAPVLAAREAAWRRDQLVAAAVQAERAKALAAFEQAEAARRVAAAISYRAWIDSGRRYRYP